MAVFGLVVCGNFSLCAPFPAITSFLKYFSSDSSLSSNVSHGWIAPSGVAERRERPHSGCRGWSLGPASARANMRRTSPLCVHVHGASTYARVVSVLHNCHSTGADALTHIYTLRTVHTHKHTHPTHCTHTQTHTPYALCTHTNTHTLRTQHGGRCTHKYTSYTQTHTHAHPTHCCITRYGTRIKANGAVFLGTAPAAQAAYFTTQNCTTFPILNCQYISDTWGVDYGVTWGIAPVRFVYWRSFRCGVG